MILYDEMMRRTEKAIKKCDGKFQKELFEYRNYVSKIETRRGYASPRTIEHHVKTITYFIRERDIQDYNEIEEKNILKHLSNFKRRKNVLAVFRKFSEFLYIEKTIFSEEKYNEIMKIKTRAVTEKIIAPGEEKKYVIEKKRWTEVYNLSIIKNSIPKRFAVWLALNFGLRLGEILHLTTNDIILADISYLLIRANNQIDFDDWEPKTISSNRRIYITDQQKKQFEMYFRIRENKQSDYLIYNRNTKERSIPVKEDSMRKALEECYLDFYENGKWVRRYLRFHVFRYSSAVFYYFNTRNIYSVSKMLGHSSIKQTEEYLGLTEAQIFDEIKNMMEEAFKK